MLLSPDTVVLGDVRSGARSALGLMETQCQAALVRRHEEFPGGRVPPRVAAALACHGGCGGRGECLAEGGRCLCREGFGGDDCSEIVGRNPGLFQFLLPLAYFSPYDILFQSSMPFLAFPRLLPEFSYAILALPIERTRKISVFGNSSFRANAFPNRVEIAG